MDWTNPITYAAICAILGAIVGAVIGIIKIGKWIQRKDSLESNFDQFIEKMEGYIDEIRKDIRGILNKLDSSTVTGESPLRLNELGETISEVLGANTWAQKTAAELCSRVKGKHPYEIQEFCRDYLRREFNPSEDFLKKMKDCAYNNAISIEEVQDVLVIKLRDALLNMFTD